VQNAPDARNPASAHDELQDPDVVYVLNGCKDGVAYTMHKPASTYAACTCNMGKQGSVCSHQVAWLLDRHPYGDSAERLIVKMLGTRLGFVGGCSMEDIEDLSWELSMLRLKVMCPSPTAARADANGEGDGTPAVEEPAGLTQDENVQSQSAPAPRPTPPGERAHQNFLGRMESLLHQQLAGVREAPPERQRDLMVRLETAQLSLLQDIQAAAKPRERPQPCGTFCVTGDGHFLRRRSCVEGPRKGHKGAANPAAKWPRQDFVNTRVRDSSSCISKALREGRGAMQDAKHVQNCMNTSHATSARKAGGGRQLQQLQPQLLQRPHQQQTANMAPRVMPQQPLNLLQDFLMRQDSRRLKATASAGVVVPRSRLAFTPPPQQQQHHHHHHRQLHPVQSLSLQQVLLQQQQQQLPLP
jgi:hypothetical protein